ncbi:uncharacterized protein LOC139911346 [Centroberyx gerrardi]|uniref:uncharacterized protein n=1 Tax=Centroberyx gerrardi TaxID=166262 RepID=UPI003AAB6855
MQLLLTACLTWALLHTAESLRCHRCADQACSNTTSVDCPATSTACRTATSVMQTGSTISSTVVKSCSSLLNCTTPLTVETELSVNRGFSREAHTQLCCATDNCNFQTLAVPSTSVNGKHCPSCSSLADSLAGSCSAALSCAGVENSCFNGTTPSGSTQASLLGCMSRNLCFNLAAQASLLGSDARITCKAPWSVRVSAALLTFGLTACKVLV